MIPAVGIPRVYNVIYYFECVATRNEGNKRVSKWGAGVGMFTKRAGHNTAWVKRDAES